MPFESREAVRLWTADEVRALPEDGNRYEVIDGVLVVNGTEVPGGDLARLGDVVTPSPGWSHQRLVRVLMRALDGYVMSQRLGEVIPAPADVVLDRDLLAQPDLFVTATPADSPPRPWSERGPLRLVVEIVSPSSAHRDRFTKRLRYQRAGIPEYWIVDADARMVERWRPEDERPEVLFERLEWRPDSTVAALVIDLVALFREVLGE